jgi:hypothetical protein
MSRRSDVLRPARVLALATSLMLPGLACDSPTSPTTGAVVTFRVVNETFRAHLTSDAQVRAAEEALAGGAAKIPNGRIVAGAEVNAGWSWHLEEVSFAEAAIELCDGLPSHVEREGVRFGAGRYCPWSARILEIDYEGD